MYKSILTTFLFIIAYHSSASSWNDIKECGIYNVNAIARSTKKGLIIKVNENSLSELTIRLLISNESKVAPYLNHPIEARILLEQEPRGLIISGKVLEVKSRIPNPLNSMDSGMKLIKKIRCKK